MRRKIEIFAVFGDDPAVNDRAILELGRSAFCIPTSKNAHLTLPAHCLRATWQQIKELAHDQTDWHYRRHA